MTEDTITALVCATDAMVRQTAASAISAKNYDLGGEVASAADLMQLAQLIAPELIVVDNDLPGIQAVEWLPKILEVAPTAAIILIANDDHIRDAAMEAGAFGVVYKTNLHELDGALSRARQWLEDPDLHRVGERRTGKDRRWHVDWQTVTSERRDGADRRDLG